MAEPGRRSWRRAVNRYLSPATAVIGIAIILSSSFFAGNLFAWYATVTVGLMIVLAGFLYGAYPFLTNERRYIALRKEVDRFVGLVRQLNAAATSVGSDEELERVKSAMLDSVERMAKLAGVEDEHAA